MRCHALPCWELSGKVTCADCSQRATGEGDKGQGTRESHTAITSYNIYEVRVVATYNTVLPHYLWDLIVGPELSKYAYRTCSWFQPAYGDDEETLGSSCIYFRISSMRVRQTIADWLVTSDGVSVFDLGMQHPGEDPSEVRLSFAYTFLQYWGRILTNSYSEQAEQAINQ